MPKKNGLVAFATSLVIIAAGISLISWHKNNAVVEINSTKINVEVADTQSSQEHGLSGRSSLVAGAGMLFVFNQAGNYGFWMKDMKFSLDFIWMNNQKKIVDLTQNVSPSTYPKVFYAREPIQYVLEVNAGFIKANYIQVGQAAKLP